MRLDHHESGFDTLSERNFGIVEEQFPRNNFEIAIVDPAIAAVRSNVKPITLVVGDPFQIDRAFRTRSGNIRIAAINHFTPRTPHDAAAVTEGDTLSTRTRATRETGTDDLIAESHRNLRRPRPDRGRFETFSEFRRVYAV